MRYITSLERLATERGMQQGEAVVLERLLTKRFGTPSPEIRKRLAQADTGQLEFWAERLLDAPSIDAVFDCH